MYLLLIVKGRERVGGGGGGRRKRGRWQCGDGSEEGAEGKGERMEVPIWKLRTVA